MWNNEEYMRLALAEAHKAAMADEVPIGAVLLSPTGTLLAQSFNQTIRNNDPTAHAEILVLREAARKLINYRLTDCVIYSTIEPCIMCMGAVIHARIGRVVFGAYDTKWGGCGSICNFANDPRLNHRLSITGGVLEAECREIIQRFFVEKRARKEE